MKLTFKWSRIDDLNVRELHRIIKAREAVFVVEQNCAYQEVDDLDLFSWHLQVFADQEFAAYIRLVDPGQKYKQPSIGRVMTVEKFRALKIGRALMVQAIEFTAAKFPNQGIQIGAQVYLQRFYESFGFVANTELYDEDGIPHVDMLWV